MASIVDKPKESHQNDLLGIEKYTEGLIRFISTSATPITIGIQGEWGSGKTSLLNTIKQELCDRDNAEFYPVWLNTWEYSLLSSADETLIRIITGLVEQISSMIDSGKSEKSKKAFAALGSIAKKLGGEVGGLSGKIVEMTGEALESSLAKSETNSIRALRQALQDVVNEALEKGNKKAIIFFVDDLDRLEPSVAVNILELIKNLFDLENCIFVLAIDYGVVVKGLQSKFGVMTEENEWEFRAFFDKIIQLPFSMPTSSYDLQKYLKNILVKGEYFSEKDLVDAERLERIVEITSLSVGTNPRALIRLVNSAALIEIIRGREDSISADERIIEFALICMQIAYPFIYGLVQRNPNFIDWDEQLASEVLKSKKVDTSDLELLEDKEEFDEDWEKNLWKICHINSFLKQRVFQISRLLNFIRDNVPKNKDQKMADALDKLLRMSSVTSVGSADNVGQKKTKRTSKKIEAFKLAMQKFIHEKIDDTFDQFLGTEYVSDIKIAARKDSGQLLITVQKDKMDFDLHMATNYEKIDFFIQNRNGRSKNVSMVQKWFQSHLGEQYPNMEFGKTTSKKRIVVLGTYNVKHTDNREKALEEFQSLILQVLERFLPAVYRD